MTFGVVVLTLLFLAPVISDMPEATLGALVLVAAAGLINIGEFRKMAQFGRREFIWGLLAFFGVIMLGTLEGILVAVLISLLMLIAQADRPPVYALGRKPGTETFRPLQEHPDDETFPGLLIARTEGRLYFANISWVLAKLDDLVRAANPQVLVLDCSAIPDIEYTAFSGLSEFDEQLREAGVAFWLANLNPTALQAVERSAFGEALGQERMFVDLQDAVTTSVQE